MKMTYEEDEESYIIDEEWEYARGICLPKVSVNVSIYVCVCICIFFIGTFKTHPFCSTRTINMRTIDANLIAPLFFFL